MLKRHYNSREIINAGEARVDSMLSDLFYEQDNWQSVHGLLLSKKFENKTGRGECDFVLVCEYGVLVLEVKGGLISYTNGQLVQKDLHGGTERVINCFEQVRGNCQTIRNLIKSKTKLEIFVGEAVVFPQSTFNYSGESFRNYWHLSSPISSLCKFLEQSLKKQASKFNYGRLNNKSIDKIIRALIPEVNVENSKEKLNHIKQENAKRGELNYKILRGLIGNKRIVVEGPPGSGKTSYAVGYILDKVAKENHKVLYLCWNELLASHTNHLFRSKGVGTNVKALCYYDYINELLSLYLGEPQKLSFSELPNIYDHVTRITSDLQSVNLLPTYDLIVIDEAQDLFHRGIDIILEKQLKGKDISQKEEFIIYYDSLQSIDKDANTEFSQLVLQQFRESSAYYKLFKYFRTVEGSGIAGFLDDALAGAIDIAKVYGSDMIIRQYKDYNSCIDLVKQWIKTEVHRDGVVPDDIIVLFSSDLVSANDNDVGAKSFDALLLADDSFDRLTNDNINSTSEKIRFTTALKYKGLEKDIVILVINDLFNERHKTFYQMYIGASRAKAKVILLIDQVSAGKITTRQLSLQFDE